MVRKKDDTDIESFNENQKTRRYFINFHTELSLEMEHIDEMEQIGRFGPLDHVSQKVI